MVNAEIINILNKYLVALSNEGIPVDKAYLFGSYARNEAKAESDIDIMLVSGIFDNAQIELKAKPWSVAEKIDIRIEPYSVGFHKFLADDVSPIIQIVKREGIEITI